jgi:hypothetical protein
MLEGKGYVVHRVGSEVVTASTKSNALRAVRNLEKVLRSKNSNGVVAVMLYGMIGILRSVAAGKIANKHIKEAFLAASKIVVKKAPGIIIGLGTALITFFNLGGIFKKKDADQSEAITPEALPLEDDSDLFPKYMHNPRTKKPNQSDQLSMFDDPTDLTDDEERDNASLLPGLEDNDGNDEPESTFDFIENVRNNEFETVKPQYSKEWPNKPRFEIVNDDEFGNSVRDGRYAAMNGDYCEGLPDTWLSIKELEQERPLGQKRFDRAMNEDRITVQSSALKTVNDAKSSIALCNTTISSLSLSDHAYATITVVAFKECLLSTLNRLPENSADFGLSPLDKKRFSMMLQFLKKTPVPEKARVVVADIESYC